MKHNGFHFFWFFFLCVLSVNAQLDSIQQLPEVFLADAKLIDFSKGFKLEKLHDSVIEKNPTSLTEALLFNSPIYFKENGFGMVSSPSFRGTNAAQTAVIWNGININSIFTGQTDFNTISPLNYEKISIRSGGGGVQYGSGAVGGSIHLNNTFSFESENATQVGVDFGSFSTLGANFNTTNVWGEHYLNVGAQFVSSKNDFDYVGKNQKNSHGEFLRFTAKINEARKLENGVATWNSEYSYIDRNFSGSLNTVGKDGYKDIATRNLWQLRQNFGKFETTASVAHLFEQYTYFPDTEKSLNGGGNANTFLGSLQSEVSVFKNFRFNGKLEYTFIDAEGENVGENSRKTLAAVVLLNHKVSKDFTYGLNFRQEFLNDFDNPFLFSADAKYTITKNYSIRVNGSKNYRVPTFNDLYWYAGGNFDLQPETSYQVELGQEISYRNLHVDLAAYYISSENLIKWIPGIGSLWEPLNISKTRNYGAEVTVGYSMKILENHKITFRSNYAYTKAEDLAKEKQLIYVPFHKATGSFQYNFKNFMLYFQGLYNGEVFTTTDNNNVVDAYKVFNLGAEFSLSSQPKITFGGRLKNVFNTYYENVAYRPMPSRYVQIFLNFNI